jgi:uncharacterized protein YndB with AHSA1/START domain
MSVVEISPIVKTVDVRRTASDAFRLFTEEISAWWPLKTHSRAKDAAGEVTLRMDIETRVGGRVFETLNTGEQREWGEVLAFEPGKRLVILFQMGLPREKAGEVEVKFEPLSAEACRVTLTHAHWERWGDEAEAMRGRFDGGWEFIFVDSFGNYAGPVSN